MASSRTGDRVERWLSTLCANGYRLTGARRAVVEVLAASDRALNPTQVFDLARQRYPVLGLATVYRTVERLEELGLVERMHLPEGCHAYLAATVGHQHVLFCERCGRAEYFNGCGLEDLIARVSADSGYVVQDHWLQLHGLCATCQRETPAD